MTETDEQPRSDVTSTDGRDPYEKLLAALSTDLIVTVNESDPTTPGTPELTVETVDEDTPKVWLTRGSDEHWTIRPERGQGNRLAVYECDAEGDLSFYEPVITIEVVGIDG